MIQPSILFLLPAVSLAVFSFKTYSRIFPESFFAETESSFQEMNRTAFGAVIFLLILFLMASLQQFKVPALKVFWIFSIAAGFFEMKKALQMSRSKPYDLANGGLWLLSLWFAAAALMALLPADEKDELIYHLEIPRQMLAHGGWARLPDNIYAFFPHGGELVFGFGMALGGEVGARFFHLAFGALLTATLFIYARQTMSSFWAGICAALFVTVPSVAVMLSWAYVDLIFTWFAFLAWILAEKENQSPAKKKMLLAGLFCGAAASVKYTGIQWMLLLSVFLLLRGLLQKRTARAASSVLLLGAGFAAVFAPYLIRNYMMTGWPLYPFAVFDFPLNFGLNWDQERARLLLDWMKTFGLPEGQASFFYTLSAPVRIFLMGQFNAPEYFDGVIGPVFLLLPVFYFLGIMKKTSYGPPAFCLLFFYYWLATTRQARFVLPVLPLLLVLLVQGLTRIRMFFAAIILTAALGFNLAATGSFWAAKKPWGYWVGKETRHDYLARQHGVYAMYAATNRILTGKPAKVYLIHAKNYGYYLNVPWTGDFIFERHRLEKKLKTKPTPREIEAFFREIGATHLLIDQHALRSPQTGLDAKTLEPLNRFLNEKERRVALKGGILLYELDNSAVPPASV